MSKLRRLLVALLAGGLLGIFAAPEVPLVEAAAKKPAAKKKSSPKKKKKKKRRYNFPIPTPLEVDTQSVGIPGHGRLYNPSEVPLNGESLAVRKSNQLRKTNYATEALVDTLQYAADAVHAKNPQARIFIGDASAFRGGQLTTHKSHQSGLDVDITLILKDAHGNVRQEGEFIKLNRHGKSPDGKWQLDADLSWVFVEALLTSPAADVQYLFIYGPLKEMILEAGQRAGANPEILTRASYVMQQPRDSSPHADHFHLRIYCPITDRFDGCMAFGIIWPWVEGIKPGPMAPLAHISKGKASLAWAIDGSSLEDCDEGGDPDPALEPGAPMDGDYICVDPAEYDDDLLDYIDGEGDLDEDELSPSEDD